MAASLTSYIELVDAKMKSVVSVLLLRIVHSTH